MRTHILLAAVASMMLMSGSSTCPAEDDKDEALAKYQENLKGSWQLTTLTVNGQKFSEEMIKNRTFIFDGKNYGQIVGDKIVDKKTYKLDPTKKPVWFDITYPPVKGKSLEIKGIIKLEGDTLTMCLAPPDGDRPDGFVTKEGDGRGLSEHKRVKK